MCGAVAVIRSLRVRLSTRRCARTSWWDHQLGSGGNIPPSIPLWAAIPDPEKAGRAPGAVVGNDVGASAPSTSRQRYSTTPATITLGATCSLSHSRASVGRRGRASSASSAVSNASAVKLDRHMRRSKEERADMSYPRAVVKVEHTGPPVLSHP